MTIISIESTPQLLWQAVREMPRDEFESFFGRLVSWKNEQSDGRVLSRDADSSVGDVSDG